MVPSTTALFVHWGGGRRHHGHFATAPMDKEGAEKILALIEHLEDLDDVQNVYSNADIPADVMEQLG